VSTTRITVGLPVYKGADLISKALDCLQRQTFGNFEAIISVDGGDEETAVACRPFLTDPRFRMVVHSDRLDWVGNFNWLLQQDLKEFFCYRQHDDTTAPEFFETLLQAADEEPDAAAIYADCRYSGSIIHGFTETFPSIEGEPLERLFQYVQRISAVPVRGLIRLPAIRHAGRVRSDEFRAFWQISGWLAKLLHWGNFKRVPKAIYYRLYRDDGFGRQIQFRSELWKQNAWPTIFTALLDAVIPICRTPEERLFMQQVILDQIVAWPNLVFDPPNSPDAIIAKCVERVKLEGNSHLLDVQDLPAIVEGQKRRLEIMWSRSRVRKAIYESRQAYRLAKLVHPQSVVRRASYQIRHSADMLRRLASDLRRRSPQKDHHSTSRTAPSHE
jgi:glycosyltransferase involved in cell wall biosynthesis